MLPSGGATNAPQRGRRNCCQPGVSGSKSLVRNKGAPFSFLFPPSWPARFLFLCSWHNLKTAQVVATASSGMGCEFTYSFIPGPCHLNPGRCSSLLAGATLGFSLFSLAIYIYIHVHIGGVDGMEEMKFLAFQSADASSHALARS